MLSIELIRRDPEAFRAGLKRRREDAGQIDKILEIDSRRRAVIAEGDAARSKRNAVSKEIGQLRAKKQNADTLIEEMRILGDRIKEMEEQTKLLDDESRTLLLSLPNVPQADVPDGDGSEQNIVARTW